MARTPCSVQGSGLVQDEMAQISGAWDMGCSIVAFSPRESALMRSSGLLAGAGKLQRLCSGMWSSGRQSGYKSCKNLSDIVLGHDKGDPLRESARVLYALRISLSLNGDRAPLLVPEKGRRFAALEDRSW